MSVRPWLSILLPPLLAGAAWAQEARASDAPSPAPTGRVLLRLDALLSGRGGAKGGGGTEIEDTDRPGTSAGFQSTTGAGIAAEVRAFKAVWVEAGGSWFEPDLEVVRSHGLGEPIEVYEDKVSVTSYALGIDVRPTRWLLDDALQISVFARQVWSRYGSPPESAQVTMDESASGLNAGVRADWRLPGRSWILGMDLSFGGPSPAVRDPLTGSEHDAQTADLYVAFGVRWAT